MIFKGPWYVIKESWSFLTLQKSLCGKRLSRLRPSEHHPSKKAGSTCRLTTALMKQKSMLFSTTHLSVHVKSGLNSFIEITYIIYNKSSSHNFFSSWKTVSQKQHKLQSRFFSLWCPWWILNESTVIKWAGWNQVAQCDFWSKKPGNSIFI